jgi:hypothetical protein
MDLSIAPILTPLSFLFSILISGCTFDNYLGFWFYLKLFLGISAVFLKCWISSGAILGVFIPDIVKVFTFVLRGGVVKKHFNYKLPNC